MKKNIIFFLFSIFSSFYCNTKFEKIISKAPIIELPFGWSETIKTDSTLYSFDYDNPKMYRIPFGYDTLNQYELNNLFKFENLKIKNKADLVWNGSHVHGKLYFVARLPPIQNNEELLVYKTSLGYDPWDLDTELPFFILVKVNNLGVILETYGLGGLGHRENDFMLQILFYIDTDYKIYIEHFLQPYGSDWSPFKDVQVEKFNCKYFYKYKPLGQMIDLKNEK